MGHVFISYSRRDTETVDQAVAILQKAGIPVWLDREDILTGSSWRAQIVEAIDTCDAFVLMLSANSVISENVHKEVILAADANRKIMVLMLEPVKIPAEIRYQLAGLQFIDVQTIGFEKGMEQLISALQDHLKKIKEAGEKKNSQTELVIQGVDLSQFTADKQEQLLAFIANLANTDRAQLNIASMTAGSVHVFVNMPASTAYQLMSMALNHNERFASMGIVSLRVNGAAHYIHIADGAMLPNATRSTNPLLRYMLAFFAVILVLIALWIFFLKPAAPPSADEVPAAPLLETATFTPTFTPAATATATQTVLASDTPTSTATPVAYEVLTGVLINERSACNYGPGDLYLNNESLIQGIKLEVFGRDINSGWAYVQADGYPEPCWVNLNSIELDGEIDSLEIVYPGKIQLPPSDFWDPPQNVYTARDSEGRLAIYWDEFILADGDLEGSGAPRYLLELRLCKDGELTFNTIFAWENNIVVEDEAGCSAPSSGVIYLAEKHGYPGPVEIPWTAYP